MPTLPRTKLQPRPELPRGEYQLRIIGPHPRVVRLDRPSLTIGSSAENDLQLADDPFVSRSHAVVTVKGDVIQVRDLGTSNLTWLLAPGGRETGLPISGIPAWLPGYGLRLGATEVWLEAVPSSRQRAEGFHGILGSAAVTLRLIDDLRRWGPVDAPVILEGASGTGKELAARALHAESRRREAPFVAVNCGAIPEASIEDELFGHVRGAFTGADADRPGHFRTAHGGTLFLDEIHQLSGRAQVSLLRALEAREVVPLGSSKGYAVDVRIVVAANVSLGERVADGKFAFDLYQRLQVGVIPLPGLVDRPGDLPVLVAHFAVMHGGGELRWSRAAMEKLAGYRFPGNLRELKNVVQRAVVHARGHGEVRPDDVVMLPPPERAPGDAHDVLPLRGKTMEDCERHIWLAAVRRERSVDAACEALGLSRSTGFRLKQKWGPEDGA